MGTGTRGRGGDAGAVTVRAGQVLETDRECFWARLLEAAAGPGDVIADLGGTVSLSGKSVEIIAFVAACVRAGHRRFGVVADGPARSMAEAAGRGRELDIVSSAGELASLWGTP